MIRNGRVEHANGMIVYYMDNKYHRVDGPALIHGADKEYYINGQPHREDGPAYHWNNEKIWCLKGREYSFDDWCKTLMLTDTEIAMILLCNE